MMSRNRLFKAISAGLFPVESSQFSKSLIRTLCSTCGWLIVTTTLAETRLASWLHSSSPKNAQCLGDRLVETLRGDLDCALDALHVTAFNPACSDSHWPKISVSLYLRHAVRLPCGPKACKTGANRSPGRLWGRKPMWSRIRCR
jgi:hypothetical protein